MNFSVMHSFNATLFQLVYQGAGYWPLLDRFFILLTSYVTYAVAAVVVIYVVLIVPFRTRDIGERLRRFARGGELALSLFITWAVVWIIKVLIAPPATICNDC